MPDQSAGEYLRLRREALDMTREDLAFLLKKRGFDISVQAIARLETSASMALWADGPFVQALAAVLDDSPVSFLIRTGHIQEGQLRLDLRRRRLVDLFDTLTHEQAQAVEVLIRTFINRDEKQKP